MSERTTPVSGRTISMGGQRTIVKSKAQTVS